MSENDFSRWEPGAKRGAVIPVFFVDTFEHEAESRAAGRPVHKEREMVKMLIPGDRRNVPVAPVNEDHIKRWPKEYEAFKAGREPPLEGTPLTEWPNAKLNRARCEDLAYFNIKTVEHLAAVNDAQLANLGMGGRELREAARKFLEVSASGTGPLEKLVAENFRLKDDLERMTRERDEALALLERARTQEVTHARA